MTRTRLLLAALLAPACAIGVEDATTFGLASGGEAGPGADESSTSAAAGTDAETGATSEATGAPPGDSGDDESTSETGAATCGAGDCEPLLLATGVTFADHLRAHGSRLFVGSDDGVLSIPTEGGPATILADGHARGLVVDDERVYWVDELDHSLYSVPIGGGPRELVVVTVTQPAALEGDADNLYWIDNGVVKRAKHDGVAHVIVPPDGNGFVPWQLAVGDERVYWRSEDGELRSANLGGGGDTVLATGNEMRAVAVNSTHVFAMRRDGVDEINTLLRIPKNGGPIEELIGGQPNVLPLIADDETVYWATEFGAPTRILAMPVAGGPVEVLAELTSQNAVFTVHERVLYWAEQELGTISKLAL